MYLYKEIKLKPKCFSPNTQTYAMVVERLYSKHTILYFDVSSYCVEFETLYFYNCFHVLFNRLTKSQKIQNMTNLPHYVHQHEKQAFSRN